MQLARSGPVQFFDSSGPLIAWSSGLKFVAVKTDQSSLSAFLTGFDRRTPRMRPCRIERILRERQSQPVEGTTGDTWSACAPRTRAGFWIDPDRSSVRNHGM